MEKDLDAIVTQRSTEYSLSSTELFNLFTISYGFILDFTGQHVKELLYEGITNTEDFN
jgi:hypothetical protein